VTALPADLADPRFQIPSPPLEAGLTTDDPERVFVCGGTRFRLHIDPAGADPPALLLPLDRFFDIRAMNALRLWRGLSGRPCGRDPAALSKARRDRLILALRALDGRLDKASYRDIASALFGPTEVSRRDWQTHDLRDRTIRLARTGFDLMRGGYRNLLRHPYRGTV